MMGKGSKDAYGLALEGFRAGDPELMAMASGARYQDGTFSLAYLSHPLRVTFPHGEVSCEGLGLTRNEEVLALRYLAGASGLPPRSRWLSFLELPGGPHHYAPFQKEALEPLAEAFAGKPAEFYDAVRAFGGSPYDAGDMGGLLPVYPKLTLAVIVWSSGSAAILFDQVASTYLDTASLYVLGIEAAERLLGRP